MTRRAIYLAAVAAFGLAAPSAAQRLAGIADPAELIDGFAASCLSGFPNEQTVTTAATAAGFVERRTFIPADSSLPKGTVLPRMFQRGESMMSLGTLGAAANHARSCQVSAMATGKPDPAAFFTAVASRLKLAAPTLTGKRDALHADWPVGQRMTLRAQISRYRSVRSYSLQLMNYREGAAG